MRKGSVMGMSTKTWRAALLVVVAGWGLLSLPAAVADHAPGGPGTASAAEDDPEGCTTATGESDEQCGAQGRDHFLNTEHQPPIDACAERTTEGGGRITRILPDGPRRGDGTPAFITGACVYLPPGYDAGDLRYPVMYLLHGGGGDQADWVTFGDVEGILERDQAADPANAMIVVMPDGRSGQWYDYEDGSFRLETYVLDHVIPYVDSHFRTIADRQGRVVAGLSNGGYGALHLAAKRPDRFVAAGAMSSNLGARGFSGLGPSDAVHYQGSVPYQLAQNYDEVDLILDLGTSCQSDITVDLCATIAVDLAFLPDHIAFANQMEAVEHEGTFDYRETEGAHAWRWWTKWLAERDLPFFHERLLPPQPVRAKIDPAPLPESFRYRSIAPEFSVWDHHVEVDRTNREFLDLTDVSVGGFTVQGSGTATVTTARRYRPGAVFAVQGASDEAHEVVADREGRLTIVVDLGPSHDADQFTPEAQVAEATGDHWTIREVTIAPTGRSSEAPPAPDHAGVGSSPLGPEGTPAAVGGRTVPAGDHEADDTGAAAVTDPETAPEDPVAIDGERAAAVPDLLGVSRGPQLVPTVVFLAMLAAAPTAWWYRRRRREEVAA